MKVASFVRVRMATLTLLLTVGMAFSAKAVVDPNAPSTWVNVLDYGALGNGTHDDTTNIQAAINAVPSTGGKVFFPRGTYMLNRSTTSVDTPYMYNLLLKNKTNVVLEGVGRSSELFVYRVSSGSYTRTDPTILEMVNAPGAEVRAIRFVGAGKSYNTRIGDQRPGNGITVYNSTLDNISDCSFEDTNIGLLIWNSSWVTASGNRIGGIAAQSGIEFYANGTSYNDNLVITGNTLDGGTSQSIGMGIRGSARYSTIANNILRNVLLEHIVIEGALSQFLTITGNTIRRDSTNYAYGIALRNCDRSTVADNTMDGASIEMWAGKPTYSGWSVSHNVVQGNQIRCQIPNVNGFYISTVMGSTVDDNIIANNRVTSTKVGIHLAAGKNNKITGNLISDTGGNGIVCETPNTLINGNVLVNIAGHGIYGTATNLTIIGNVLSGANTSRTRPVFINAGYSACHVADNESSNFPYGDYLGTGNARSFISRTEIQIQATTSAPAYPVKGSMYMDDSTSKLRIYDGSTWQNAW